MRALHHLASKASLFQRWKDYNSITIASLFYPTWTSFKKGMAASIYSQIGQEGRMPDWRRDCNWWRVKPSLIWWWTKSNWTGTANRSDTSLSELTHPSNHCQIDPHAEEREGGRNPQTWVSQLSSSSALINAFSQGMTTPSQSEADETDFNQIGAKSTDLGTWICSII